MFVYAAYCKGHAKIGITEDPKNRVRNLQGGCPFPIEMLTAVPLSKENAVAAERAIMESLNSAHWFGDWFKCTRNQALYALERGVARFRSDAPPVIKGTEPRPRYPKRTRPIITPDGTFESAAEAGRRYGISRQAAYVRARYGSPGWSFKE